MQVKKRNNTVDTFRLIASIFVVTVHVQYNKANPVVAGAMILFGLCCVPFFFIVSGYFYQRGLEGSPIAAFKKSFSKILRLIIIVNIIYLPLLFLLKRRLFQWKYLILGNFSHQWFLQSLLIGIVVMAILHKLKAKPYLLIGIIVVILTGALLTDSYAFIFNATNANAFELFYRPLLSIPYMLIGGLFYNNNFMKKVISVKTGLLLVIVAFTIAIMEADLIYNYFKVQEFTILTGIIFTSIGLFILSLSLQFSNSRLARYGEKYSLFVYLYHPIFVGLLRYINYTSFINGNILLLFPLLIFFVTLLTAILLDKYLNQVFLLVTGQQKSKSAPNDTAYVPAFGKATDENVFALND